MTRHLRKTLRSFLRAERPATPEAARAVLDEWFGRYRPDPALLDQVIAHHFAQGAAPQGRFAENRWEFDRNVRGRTVNGR